MGHHPIREGLSTEPLRPPLARQPSPRAPHTDVFTSQTPHWASVSRVVTGASLCRRESFLSSISFPEVGLAQSPHPCYILGLSGERPILSHLGWINSGVAHRPTMNNKDPPLLPWKFLKFQPPA